MRNILATVLVALGLSGCTVPAWSPPPPEMIPIEQTEAVYPNPVLIPISDPQCAWEAVADVIDDYFKIEHEEPVRQIGDTIQRRADRYLLPGQPDAVGTLAARYGGRVRAGGKHLANHAAAGRGPGVADRRAGIGWTLPCSRSWKICARPNTPRPAAPPSATTAPLPAWSIRRSWIRPANAGSLIGRDPVLEQRIIGHLIYNCNELGYNMQAQGAGSGVQGPGFGVPGSGL